MKKKNVLVFPCGSEIGLEINRALANSTHFTLYGGSSVDDHGKFVFENYIDGIPFIDSPDFIEEINRITDQYNIDFIVPAHDSAVLKLAENQSALNAIVVTSAAETCKICRSKGATYTLFENLIPTPKVYAIHNAMEFPVFLKPDVGQGTKGTYKVHSKAEVDFYLKRDPTLLALEYLPGKEYTVDCFTDRYGKLLFSEGRERIRINNGISVHSKQVNNPEFQKIATVINERLSFQGVWFYQIKERENGEFVLMEISPRVAGTMALFRAMGINFIQLSLFDRMGYDVEIIHNNLTIEIDRALIARYSIDKAYDFVYIDFDDTILVNNLVNTEAIKFIYQSKNFGKKIVLLTKHQKNIKETLAHFAISEFLFDEIVVLAKDQHKSDFIKTDKAIFIDDSFAERKEVFERRKIPVFGVDALESLLDWKV